MPQPLDDEEGYAEELIDALVNGEVWSEVLHRSVPTPGWLSVRAHFEKTGRIDDEEFCTVIDLERAVAGLENRDFEAAAVIYLRAWGLKFDAIAKIMRRRNVVRLAEKGQAWMAAYLSGGDPEAAYEAVR